MMTWGFKVTFLGWLSDPFQWLSDLQLGNQKVTLNHLGHNLILCILELEVVTVAKTTKKTKLRPISTKAQRRNNPSAEQ